MPNFQNCLGIPPAASICDSNSATCTLPGSIYVKSSSPTDCTLPYPYPLNLNGYDLQGDANTEIFFNNTIQNSTPPQPNPAGAVALTNVTVILNSLSKPAFWLTAASGQYIGQFNNVTVYNGSYGIISSNVQITILSSSFYNSQVGVEVLQSGNLAGRYAHVFGSNFQKTQIGVQVQSDWPRDQFVTVWQEDPYYQCDLSGNCFQDPVYSGSAYPPDFESPPQAPYTRTYSSSAPVNNPSGVEIVGNMFSNVSGWAADVEYTKEAMVASNQVTAFTGTALRAFKSKNPTFNSNQIQSLYPAYASIGIDLEYCDYQGVTHNQITATTGIATHNYGGQFRNTTGVYYNQISAYVGIEGVWDQVNTISPANAQESWNSLMVDNEVAGNNFYAYAGAASSNFTPVTSFANQAVANVPSVTTPGTTASYPIYPFDRIFDPSAQVGCGQNPAQRVNHFIPIIEASPQCSLTGGVNVGAGPTWIGNYYQGRMAGNVVGYTGPVRALSNPFPNNYYDTPVWMESAPFNMCYYSTAARKYGLSFSSFQSDYMPSVNPIPYAGICTLGKSVPSLGTLLPGAQSSFPPPTATSSNYGSQAQAYLNRTDGQDNCTFAYPRPEFPNCHP